MIYVTKVYMVECDNHAEAWEQAEKGKVCGGMITDKPPLAMHEKNVKVMGE